MGAERMKHLSIALVLDPAHAKARELLGLPPRAKKPESDPAQVAALAEYNARRDKTPNSADAQWTLPQSVAIGIARLASPLL